MKYIKVEALIPEDQFNTIADRIENTNVDKIDGVVLANLLRVCYQCGLKKRELIEMSIGDVASGGIVREALSEEFGKIEILDDLKAIFQNYISHLKNNEYSIFTLKPLFPTRNKKRYSARLLDNHLKKIIFSALKKCSDAKFDLGLEKIRQAGICNHYAQLRQKGLSPDECLHQTARFVGIDTKNSNKIRHLRNLIEGKIQPTGKKPEAPHFFSDILRQIEKVRFNPGEMDSAAILEILKKINRAVMQKKNLDEGEKKFLVAEIDASIQEVKMKASHQDTNTANEPTKTLSELIKSPNTIKKTDAPDKLAIQFERETDLNSDSQ